MPEILLHYIWHQCLWLPYPQQTTSCKELLIVSPGEHNADSGPDFSHAHIRLDGQEWVGNVELHLRSSDWYRHRHHLDPAYDTVILHVVCEADKEVYNSRGEQVPQCVLRFDHDQDYISRLIEQAQQMDSIGSVLSCYEQLAQQPETLTDGWRHTLLTSRLRCKQSSIKHLLDITQGSWEHALYISLAHNFGFHTNGIPFELTAIETPLSYLRKHRNSLFQLTAILLGQSGLLTEGTASNEEQKALFREYLFLSHKFSLHPIDSSLWKHARMRPQTFPEVRLRQFAQLIHQSEGLFSQVIDATHIDQLRSLLTLQSDPIDEFCRVLPPAPIGSSSIDILLINTLIPYKYAHALARHQESKAEAALQMLTQMPPESNTIIRQWKQLGQRIANAADSQALLQLYQNYCQPQRCINCEVGYQIFTRRQLALL